MSNFDLRKFLAEGKLYEEVTSTEEAMEPSNKQKLINAGYSESDAEDFANEFEQGGVKIPQKVKDILSKKSSSKMKMSDLKKKIRQEILAELDGAETEGPNGENVSPVAEATKDGDGEVPSKDTDTKVDIIDKEKVEVDVEKKPKATDVDNEFLDQLEDLQDEAEGIGDKKLERQIANTITYFTRQHIAQDANKSIELEEIDAPINIVTTMDGKTIVGTHQYGVGFKSNEAGKEMGFKDNPTSIPNGTKMTKVDELAEADDMALVADLEALIEGDSEFQRVDRGDKDVTAKNKAEEEVYEAGVKKGEEIEKKKLQKESVTFPLWKKLNG